jgi:hypothetical protein
MLGHPSQVELKFITTGNAMSAILADRYLWDFVWDQPLEVGD